MNAFVLVSDLLPKRFAAVYAQIRAALDSAGIPLRTIDGTRDIWCRDYMPVPAADGRLVQFRYQPSYLKGREELVTPPEVCRAALGGTPCIDSSFIIDGGNIVRQGRTCIATTRALEENSLPRDRVIAQLCELLGVERSC